jgi:hypothetical protein
VKKNNLIIVSAKKNKLKNYDSVEKLKNIYSNEWTSQTSGRNFCGIFSFVDERSNSNREKKKMINEEKNPDCDHKNALSYFTCAAASKNMDKSFDKKFNNCFDSEKWK